jgi:hypothetical protein
MTFARRLLMGAGGSGSFTSPTVFDMGAVGYWNDVASPRDAYYNGKTYMAWVKDNGDIQAAEYVHAAKTLSTPVTVAAGTVALDGVEHNAPAVGVRASDGRVMVIWAPETYSDKPAFHLSTNPEDATAFGSALLIPPLGQYGYTSIVQLTGVVNQPIYYFVRNYFSGVDHVGYFKSTDGGATWGAYQALISPGSGVGLYERIGTDGDTRIDIFVTDTDRVASPSAVCHFIFENDTLYQSDGTLIGTSFPYSADAGTLVKSAAEGSCRCGGWAYDGAGHPACLLEVIDTSTTSILYRVGRFDGAAWTIHNVASSNGRIERSDHTMYGYFQTYGAMTKNDPNTLYLMVKVGSYFEMFRFHSPDDGTTWSGVALTSGSSADNAAPDTPYRAASGLLVTWGLGTFNTDADFNFEIQGYG